MPTGGKLFGNPGRLALLCRVVQGCQACPRMDGRARVLSVANGRAGATVMFVAEAPGRHGADRTGVPLHGDATGYNFEQLLATAGWTRDEVFVTNSVLCNPREGGLNSTPTPEETANCSVHLEAQIAHVSPRIIAPIGANALAALGLIRLHGLSLRAAVGVMHQWGGRRLFPLYHMSPRALIHRSLTQQRQDFLALRAAVDSLTKGV